MAKLNIVLVEPQIPQNTGNIARTCSVTGAALHIVKPMGFTVTDAKLKRAGLDYWHMLEIYYHDNLEAFLDFARDKKLWLLSTKAGQGYSDAAYEDGCCIVFGREDAGLPRALLESMPERCLRIPMLPVARSLNLSNSVAIVAFEALRQWGFPGMTAASDALSEK